MTPTPEAAPVVRRELYPATAVLPDGSVLPLVKLVVTLERAYLFAATPDGIGQVWAQNYTTAELPPPTAPRSDAYQLDTTDGTLIVRRLPGCGCNAQALRQYRPFAGHADRRT